MKIVTALILASKKKIMQELHFLVIYIPINRQHFFLANGKKFNLPLLKKDPFSYIKSNFPIIDETIIPVDKDYDIDLFDDIKNKNDQDVGESESRQNSERNFFHDEELSRAKKERQRKSSLYIKNNLKIQKNISLILDDSENCADNTAANGKSSNDENTKYLMPLKNLEDSKEEASNNPPNFGTKNSINQASANNVNIIQAKNSLNNVGNIFKKDIIETNKNLIYDNHYMIPGLSEITKLTGNYFLSY